MANQPIPVETANLMIAAYRKYMEDHDVNMDQQTQAVSFTGTSLMNWLNEVMPYADEIRIFNGLYDAGTHSGRTTVILWPYRDGQPAIRQQAVNGDNYIQPYNEGQLYP